jgi:hypothetical protein
MGMAIGEEGGEERVRAVAGRERVEERGWEREEGTGMRKLWVSRTG